MASLLSLFARFARLDRYADMQRGRNVRSGPHYGLTRHDREQFLKLLQAHAQTIAIGEACAATTRDLATEIVRGGTPTRNDLLTTIAEAERVLTDLEGVREEVERLLATFGSP